MHEENKYMNVAIKEGAKALKNKEMPVGCVIVHNEKIIGKGYNRKEKTNDPTMHAEIIAIKQASKKMLDWRLNDCTMYVTLEPCSMCMGAIVESRIKNIFCGEINKKSHNLNIKITKEEKISIKYGLKLEEIDEQLENFFKTIRNR